MGMFLCSNDIVAKEVVLITHNGKPMESKHIKEIINKKFEIPNRMIKVFETKKPCILKTNTVFHFCVDSDKEMKTLKKSPEFYRKNLRIFREL